MRDTKRGAKNRDIGRESKPCQEMMSASVFNNMQSEQKNRGQDEYVAPEKHKINEG